MVDATVLLHSLEHTRLDGVGDTLRRKRTLELVSEVLVGDRDDQAPEWWRDRADRLDDIGEAEVADRLRQIAALIEEANL